MNNPSDSMIAEALEALTREMIKTARDAGEETPDGASHELSMARRVLAAANHNVRQAGIEEITRFAPCITRIDRRAVTGDYAVWCSGQKQAYTVNIMPGAMRLVSPYLVPQTGCEPSQTDQQKAAVRALKSMGIRLPETLQGHDSVAQAMIAMSDLIDDIGLLPGQGCAMANEGSSKTLH